MPELGSPAIVREQWLRLTPETPELAYRYLQVMYAMNRPTYANEPADQVAPRMLRQQHEFYYYLGIDFELVIGFRWHKRRRSFELKSLGFVGDVSPAEALEHMVHKLTEFMRRNDLNRIFAVRPFTMESQEVLKLYDLAFAHRAIDICGAHQLAAGTFLWLRLRDAVSSSSDNCGARRALR